VQVALFAALLAAAIPLEAQNSVALFHKGAMRAIILSGRNNHDWRTTTPYLRKLLLETGRFDVRVNEEPAGMTGDTLAAYHVVVLDYNGPRWGRSAESALEEFVEQGRGLVVVHGASWAFNGLPVLADGHVPTNILEPAWPEYRRMIGGIWSVDPPPTGHAPRHSFTVKIVDREHPITKGMPESFVINDELYHNMRMQPDVHVLAAAFDESTGKDEPILWTVAYGKGRVFHTTLGHDVEVMSAPGFVTSFARGAEWAAR
jgi:type 1 glutamine amidotransferase